MSKFIFSHVPERFKKHCPVEEESHSLEVQDYWQKKFKTTFPPNLHNSTFPPSQTEEKANTHRRELAPRGPQWLVLDHNFFLRLLFFGLRLLIRVDVKGLFFVVLVQDSVFCKKSPPSVSSGCYLL